MKIIKPEFKIVSAPSEEVMYKLLADAGRICYKSERKSANSDRIFLRNRIADGHESILEHATISVLLTCDRGVSHELVRHRIASYSQESTRYCNYAKDKFDSQVTYINIAEGATLDPNIHPDKLHAIVLEWYNACEDAERHYFRMLELGATPQISRSVLNNSTKTEIMVTMNIRSWRNFFRLRCATVAHPQMRQISTAMLETFKELWPVLFDDIFMGGAYYGR